MVNYKEIIKLHETGKVLRPLDFREAFSFPDLETKQNRKTGKVFKPLQGSFNFPGLETKQNGGSFKDHFREAFSPILKLDSSSQVPKLGEIAENC